MGRLARLYQAWGKNEEAQRWRAEQERAERHFIRGWLILSELVPYEGADGVKALNEEQIAGEAQLQPRAGDRVQAGGKTTTWKEHRDTERYLDFSAIYRDPANFKLAYAVCYIHADAERDDLVLRVGSDDQARICLNGEEIYWQPRPRGLELDHDEVAITLRKGVNVLVFKVINTIGPGPHGSVHITTKNGDAAEGIDCRLTP